MSHNSPSLETAQRVDRLCDQFEAAFKRGERPTIEAILANAAVSDRPELLAALVGLERELRTAAGEALKLDDFRRRFPADVAVIEAAWNVRRAAKSTRDPGSTIVATTEPAPQTIGRFRIIRQLGSGGFGAVYLCHDPRLDRNVAIKVPHAARLKDESIRQRFVREAKAAAGLNHPNICRVHEVSEADGGDFIVMEYVEGHPLTHYVSRGGVQPRQAALLVRKLAIALDEAHSRGIIHRDIKPANVIINARGEPVVMDFGLARMERTADEPSLTHSGAILGSPAYMSPEQARGAIDEMGPAADIYSLGVVLYELLCGMRPFQGSTVEIIGSILHVDPPPPSRHRPDLDPSIVAICMKAMAKKATDRHASMKEFAASLGGYLKGQSKPASAESSASVESLSTIVASNLNQPVPIPPPKQQQIVVQPDVRRLVPHPPKKGRQPSRNRANINTLVVVACALVALIVGTYLASTLFFPANGKKVSDRRKKTPAAAGKSTIPEPGKGTDAVAGAKPTEPAPAIAPFSAAEAKAYQEAWAKHLGVPVEYENSLGMKFRLIPPGEFTMGSDSSVVERGLALVGENKQWPPLFRSESPKHKVRLTRPVYLGVHEVRQIDYEAITGYNPSMFAPTGFLKDAEKGLDTSNHPVERTSWYAATDFCTKLSQKEQLKPQYPYNSPSGQTVATVDGNGYRLPTEAEWEFACRAGVTTKYSTGDDDAGLSQTAWIGGNSGGRTHPVGELKANSFGIHDMHGNAWEWVQDWWAETYYQQFQEQPAIDPLGPASGDMRVVRGGDRNQDNLPFFSRASLRFAMGPATNNFPCGFRVALTVEAVKQALAAAKSLPPTAKAPFDAAQAKAYQEAWAKHLGVPIEHTNSLGMKFRLIPPGEFTMGSDPSVVENGLATAGGNAATQGFFRSESPHHKVRLTEPFYLGVHEVRQRDYKAIMGETPSLWAPEGEAKALIKGLDAGELPVHRVTWFSAIQFCTELNAQDQLIPAFILSGFELKRGPNGRSYIDTPYNLKRMPRANGYRLPSEAEWEFACRAGSTRNYATGDDVTGLKDAAWIADNAAGRPHVVGEAKANALGICDMHGNVSEWVWDIWEEGYYGNLGQSAVNPLGPDSGPMRVIRGGDILKPAIHSRSSGRFASEPLWEHASVGFRLAISVDGVKRSLEKKLRETQELLTPGGFPKTMNGPSVWTDLFNGQDLLGWKALPSKSTKDAARPGWAVRPEERILESLGEDSVDLESERTFRNFNLKLEWRFTPSRKSIDSDSGVVLRTRGLTTAGANAELDPRGVEIDLRANQSSDPKQGTGCFVARGTRLENDTGEADGVEASHLGHLAEPKLLLDEYWNKTEITCDGGRISVSINGAKVSEAWRAEDVAGSICLRSQPAAIQFRNIRIRDLGTTPLMRIGQFSGVDDAFIRNKQLDRYPDLTVLIVKESTITGQGLRELRRLTGLEELDLSNNPNIGDEGLENLSKLKLRTLRLNKIQMTDKGIPALKQLKDLKVLEVKGNQLSEDGIAELRAALPNCRIP